MWKTVFYLTILPSVVSIVCYHGMSVSFPGNLMNVNETMRVCRNGNYCMRAYGKMNGDDSWFSGCVKYESISNLCGNYPNCARVTAVNALSLTDYTTCCCTKDLCNDNSLIKPNNGSSSTTSVVSGSSSTSLISGTTSSSINVGSTTVNGNTTPTTTTATKSGSFLNPQIGLTLLFILLGFSF